MAPDICFSGPAQIRSKGVESDIHLIDVDKSLVRLLVNPSLVDELNRLIREASGSDTRVLETLTVDTAGSIGNLYVNGESVLPRTLIMRRFVNADVKPLEATADIS